MPRIERKPTKEINDNDEDNDELLVSHAGRSLSETPFVLRSTTYIIPPPLQLGKAAPQGPCHNQRVTLQSIFRNCCVTALVGRRAVSHQPADVNRWTWRLPFADPVQVRP